MNPDALTYASVCSGIESASVAWEPLGMRPIWFSEIEPFPSAVLKHHWPHVYNWGDFTKIPARAMRGAADILVGGTPCQAFSVAGKRESLNDDRGNLTLEFCRLADELDPHVITWENVPGVLTTGDNAFGCFLAKLCGNEQAALPTEPPTEQEINRNAKVPRVTGPKSKHWRWDKSALAFVPKWPTCGAAVGPDRRVAWRVLDAQYFGVAQRRRRVFVVASPRDRVDPAKILFEFDGVRRDTPPSRETGQGAPRGVAAGSHWDGAANPHPPLTQSHNTGGIGQSNQEIFSGRGAGLTWPAEVASTLNASFGKHLGQENQHINGGAPLFVPCDRAAKATSESALSDVSNCITSTYGNGVGLATRPMVYQGVSRCLTGGRGQRNDPDTESFVVRAIHDKATRHAGVTGRGSGNGLGIGEPTDPMFTLTTGDQHAVEQGPSVRRLTPIECERLQGFPPNHTLLPYGTKAKLDAELKEYYQRWLGRELSDDEVRSFCGDGPRYKAIGNSKAVPAVRWLGQRIIKHLKGEI